MIYRCENCGATTDTEETRRRIQALYGPNTSIHIPDPTTCGNCGSTRLVQVRGAFSSAPAAPSTTSSTPKPSAPARASSSPGPAAPKPVPERMACPQCGTAIPLAVGRCPQCQRRAEWEEVSAAKKDLELRQEARSAARLLLWGALGVLFGLEALLLVGVSFKDDPLTGLTFAVILLLGGGVLWIKGRTDLHALPDAYRTAPAEAHAARVTRWSQGILVTGIVVFVLFTWVQIAGPAAPDVTPESRTQGFATSVICCPVTLIAAGIALLASSLGKLAALAVQPAVGIVPADKVRQPKAAPEPATASSPAPAPVEAPRPADPALDAVLREFVGYTTIVFGDRRQAAMLDQIEAAGPAAIPSIADAVRRVIAGGRSISEYENAAMLCEAIGRLGRGTSGQPQAYDLLVEWLQRPRRVYEYERTRGGVVRGLAELGDPRAADVLGAALQEARFPDLRAEIERAISLLRPPAPVEPAAPAAPASGPNPFVFRSGASAATPHELAQLSYENLDEAETHFVEGHFAAWLDYIGRADLAASCRMHMEITDMDLRDNLIYFLDYVTYSEEEAGRAP